MLRQTCLRHNWGYQPTRGVVSGVAAVGGLPFYGNIYQGKIETDMNFPAVPSSAFASHAPRESSPFAAGMPTTMFSNGHQLWADPVVAAQIKKCPYFALCDQVVYHNMDPAHLDPGVLTQQEHYLLLLYSRAYFEKWWLIHSNPAQGGTKMRLQAGCRDLTTKMLEKLGVPRGVQNTLFVEFMFDDSQLIGMAPGAWLSASLDEFNRDHLTGRVLEFAGLTATQRRDFHTLISQMRRLYIKRNDTAEKEIMVVPFEEITTLWALNELLGLKPYSNRIKTYTFTDNYGTKMVMSLTQENQYFDFLYTCFYKSNLELATLGDLASKEDCAGAYTVCIEPQPPEPRWL